MTHPISDADRAKAAELLESHRVIAMDVGLDRAIAAALAAERAAAVADLRARVEAVAEELEEPVFRAAVLLPDWDMGRQEGEDSERRRIADRLRAAVTDTTGDPA